MEDIPTGHMHTVYTDYPPFVNTPASDNPSYVTKSPFHPDRRRRRRLRRSHPCSTGSRRQPPRGAHSAKDKDAQKQINNQEKTL